LAVAVFAIPNVSASQDITVILDGQVLEFDVPPAIMDGRTMVPMRVIFEALGATVQWEGVTQTIFATTEDLEISAMIGFHSIRINGQSQAMDVAPVIVNGRTLVPIRFVSEAFGADVAWHGNTRTVVITTNQQSVQPTPQPIQPQPTQQPTPIPEIYDVDTYNLNDIYFPDWDDSWDSDYGFEDGFDFENFE